MRGRKGRRASTDLKVGIGVTSQEPTKQKRTHSVLKINLKRLMNEVFDRQRTVFDIFNILNAPIDKRERQIYSWSPECAFLYSLVLSWSLDSVMNVFRSGVYFILFRCHDSLWKKNAIGRYDKCIRIWKNFEIVYTPPFPKSWIRSSFVVDFI